MEMSRPVSGNSVTPTEPRSVSLASNEAQLDGAKNAWSLRSGDNWRTELL